MHPRPLSPADIPAVLPSQGRVFVQLCASESRPIAEAIMTAGEDLGALTFTGIAVPGINRHTYLANPRCRFETFFMTPELKAAGAAVTFLPFCYAHILRHFVAVDIDAAVFSVAPPDVQGRCSFGPTADFLPDLWPRVPIRIAHINPALPSIPGSPSIPLDALHFAFEERRELPEARDGGNDALSEAISTSVASFLPNDVTIQTGIGKLPGAILRGLKDHRHLRIHSGLIGDAAIELLESGAIEQGRFIAAGAAIGSRAFYERLPASGIEFRPTSFTHDNAVLSAIPRLVMINSAMEIDLFGQAHAEAGPDGWISGAGGAGDFARGALASDGGIRILALSATARGRSRIVPPGTGRGPVSLSRHDVDLLVTEHGVADLRFLTHEQRARAIIAVSADEHRDSLARAWRDGPADY